MIQPRVGFLVAMILYTILMKCLPYLFMRWDILEPNLETKFYLWNFSPMLAVCLFSGAIFPKKLWAFLIPLGIQFGGDLAIWLITNNRQYAFYDQMFFSYLCLAMVVSCGIWLRNHRTILGIFGTSFLAAGLFFLITNFGVWLLNDTIYERTFSGLLGCYWAAIPFYRQTLISTILFSFVLFSKLGIVESPVTGLTSAKMNARS